MQMGVGERHFRGGVADDSEVLGHFLTFGLVPDASAPSFFSDTCPLVVVALETQSLDQSSGRQFRGRARVAGSSWRGAVCPILSVHSRVDAKCGKRGCGLERPPTQVPTAGAAGHRDCGHCHGHESDEEGWQVVCRLEAQSIDTDVQSSPPSEVLRALEADLCSNPRASRRVVLVPSPLTGHPDGSMTCKSQIHL